MKAKTVGMIALGTLSIGILVGFIVGALTLTSPGKFYATGMLVTWCIFGVASLILLVITGVIKSQELQNEQNTKNEIESGTDTDNPDVINPETTAPDITNTEATTAEQETAANEVIGHCENCGNEIRQGDTMCMECGLPVD